MTDVRRIFPPNWNFAIDVLVIAGDSLVKSVMEMASVLGQKRILSIPDNIQDVTTEDAFNALNPYADDPPMLICLVCSDARATAQEKISKYFRMAIDSHNLNKNTVQQFGLQWWT